MVFSQSHFILIPSFFISFIFATLLIPPLPLASDNVLYSQMLIWKNWLSLIKSSVPKINFSCQLNFTVLSCCVCSKCLSIFSRIMTIFAGAGELLLGRQQWHGLYGRRDRWVRRWKHQQWRRWRLSRWRWRRWRCCRWSDDTKAIVSQRSLFTLSLSFVEQASHFQYFI